MNRSPSCRGDLGGCEDEGCELALSVVRDVREARRSASAEELADFETDVLAGFVLARASAGLLDDTVRGEISNLEQVRQ